MALITLVDPEALMGELRAVAESGDRTPVVDGEITVATVMRVKPSADRRAVDGALAAPWLSAFVERIENPVSLLD